MAQRSARAHTRKTRARAAGQAWRERGGGGGPRGRGPGRFAVASRGSHWPRRGNARMCRRAMRARVCVQQRGGGSARGGREEGTHERTKEGTTHGLEQSAQNVLGTSMQALLRAAKSTFGRAPGSADLTSVTEAIAAITADSGARQGGTFSGDFLWSLCGCVEWEGGCRLSDGATASCLYT